jgi:arsenite methyltransferase
MEKAELFNQKAGSPKSKPDEILKALEITPGSKIADIGSGGGYFSLRFAESVGKNGQIYAVDTKQEFLNHIKESAGNKGIENVQTVQIAEGEVNLPENTLDLIFFRNVYHHLDDRIEYMKKFKSKLKPGGKIAIVEYKPGGNIFHFRRFFGHNVPKKKIIYELESAGFKKLGEHNFLPEQSFTIYEKPKPGDLDHSSG